MTLPGDGLKSSNVGWDDVQPAIALVGPEVVADPALPDLAKTLLQSPLAVLIYDAATFAICDANESAAIFFRLKREELLRRNIAQLLAPSENPRRQHWLNQFLEANTVVGPLRMRFAERGEITAHATVLTPDAGQKHLRLTLFQQQTSSDQTEDALRASEERYRDLFENANDIIFLHDLTGKLMAVNRAAEALTSYSRAELLGADFGILLASDARVHLLDSIRAHLGGSPTQHYELPIVSKTGVQRFLEVSTRVLYERGHPIGVQGIGRDVTERKLSDRKLLESSHELQIKNEELSKALHLAREATQLKEQFLANTSHELRTPMNGIMGMTNLLRDTQLNEEQLEYVNAVSQCANDLLTIINDLLDMSRIEAGRVSIATERFNIRESLTAVTKMLNMRAVTKDLNLSCNVDPGVPATMIGDSVRFRQILMNLVANAIKFTESGQIQVCADLANHGESLLCRVVDSGIGVEENIRERIFEAFFQADGTLRRRYGGTGLGLTISKQLAELQGGQIGTYNNAPDPGATFWFSLPLRFDEDVSISEQRTS